MWDFNSGSYFAVDLVSLAGGPMIGMSGRFTKCSGMDMEFDYEIYNEGGQNYPRYYLKQVKPQVLVLEQGTVTTFDYFAMWLGMANSGMDLNISGSIRLMSHDGNLLRNWTVVGARILKYVGPTLDSSRSELAVTRIELLHNGCC